MGMQGTEAGPRSGRFTRDQACDSLRRTSSNVAQQALPGAIGEACSPAAFELQPFSGVQHTQPEAGDRNFQLPYLLEVMSRLVRDLQPVATVTVLTWQGWRK